MTELMVADVSGALHAPLREPPPRPHRTGWLAPRSGCYGYNGPTTRCGCVRDHPDSPRGLCLRAPDAYRRSMRGIRAVLLDIRPGPRPHRRPGPDRQVPPGDPEQ